MIYCGLLWNNKNICGSTVQVDKLYFEKNNASSVEEEYYYNKSGQGKYQCTLQHSHYVKQMKKKTRKK